MENVDCIEHKSKRNQFKSNCFLNENKDDLFKNYLRVSTSDNSDEHIDKLESKIKSDKFSKEKKFSADFLPINKWQGEIQEIENNVIYAKMYDYNTQSFDFAEFHLDEFNLNIDASEVDEGDLFYFYIGKSKNNNYSSVSLLTIRKYDFDITNREKEIDEILENLIKLKSKIEQPT